MIKMFRYIKTFISAIFNYKKIVKSYSKLINDFEVKDELQRDRINICLQCENIDHKGTYCAIPDTQPCCKICGCAIKVKTINKENQCPINKW